MNVLMLHGISHDMFGKRDAGQYGTITLQEIDAGLQALSTELGASVTSFHAKSIHTAVAGTSAGECSPS